MAPDITRWSRLEPAARDTSLRAGLEARVHDPLWLLARQRQFGELSADGDLGSAIVATVTAEVAPLSTYRPGGPDRGAPARDYLAAGTPLEALIEAEPVRAEPSALLRAEAGLHFLRVLEALGVDRYADAYRSTYALEAPLSVPDAHSRRFLAIVLGRVPDALRLYADLSAALRPPAGGTPALPTEPLIEDADAELVGAAADAWLRWFDELYVEPPAGNPAWLPERMEYQFGVGAPGPGGAVALEAAEYTDGNLDWHAFDAAPGAALARSESTVLGPVSAVPTPVSYPGMPADRLWEFEDAEVNFGNVEANPEDLGRMLLTEFALVFGGDWLLVPLEVPVGSLVRVLALDVRDTFGRTTRLPATSTLEGALGGWRMFELSRARSSAGGPAQPPLDALLVPPVVVGGLHGRDVEEVLLLRDETANLAWAVERVVESASGVPLDRAQAEYERRGQTPASLPPPSDTSRYRLVEGVPEHWMPLLPQRLDGARASIGLKLGAIPRRLPDGSVEPIRPQGRLLHASRPGDDLVLREEEVPREGVRVTRSYQLARWVDGSTFLWLGRRRKVGRGEGSSGLRFDVMQSGD